jgi:DNA-directed RNA polymerase specialized sigma24 family protein
MPKLESEQPGFLTEEEPGVIETGSRLYFWDCLSKVSHEQALYLVLNNYLGYSRYEMACGLNVSYERVKYLCNKARESIKLGCDGAASKTFLRLGKDGKPLVDTHGNPTHPEAEPEA